jgi:hypothetical protein
VEIPLVMVREGKQPGQEEGVLSAMKLMRAKTWAVVNAAERAVAVGRPRRAVILTARVW